MRHVIAVCATLAVAGLAAPAARAGEAPLGTLVQSLDENQIAFVKKGGWKGGKHGRAWGHHRVRRGPPPWAPAHGYRRKRGW